MSLSNSRNRLTGISRELLKQWQDTQEVWNDRKCREFDTQYMQPLMDAVDNASVAMQDLDKILNKLRADCEYE
ncbi:MAG: hypothetical protein P1U85_16100 [Verrucomicrobiales bacterium]|jgi:hypothetical protein|nr:hypothetical protein [Verrucomicrobiales bacterium]